MLVLRSILVLLVTCFSALANSGWGGLTATGLYFSNTEDISVVEEDLRISPTLITVDYRFRNSSDNALTGEMIFPLPVLSPRHLIDFGPHTPSLKSEDIVSFAATVAGKPVPFRISRVAIIEEDDERPYDPALGYSPPGRDVTSVLREYRIPLTLDIEKINDALWELSDAEISALVGQGIVEVWGDGFREPRWSIMVHYHWKQTFASRSDVLVSISYNNLPPTFEFFWMRAASVAFPENPRILDDFCIDSGDSEGIYQSLRKNGERYLYMDRDGQSVHYVFGGAQIFQYVLQTANTWSGPIEKFRLTIADLHSTDLLFACGVDFQEAGPTTRVFEATNYVPLQDLVILRVVPDPDF